MLISFTLISVKDIEFSTIHYYFNDSIYTMFLNYTCIWTVSLQ